MASNIQHRVIKDKSARKNVKDSATIQAEADLAAQAAAELAGRQAFHNALKSGYEATIADLQDQLQTLENAPCDTCAETKAALYTDRLQFEKDRTTAVEEVTARVTGEAEAIANGLRDRINALLNEKNAVETKNRETAVRASRAEARITQQGIRHEQQTAHTKKVHEDEVAALKRQLAVGPTSLLELRFMCGSLKPRKMYHRMSERFSQCVIELNPMLPGGNSTTARNFHVNGIPIIDHSKTLQQLGIKDRDVISFQRATLSAPDSVKQAMPGHKR